jgi:RNA polymerase sigma-70 factor, ECF subfamily
MRISVQRSESETTKIEMLYRQHSPSLVLYATAIAGERARAQDVVHQIFMRLIEEGIAPHIADIKSYLFICVRNALRNEAGRYRRIVELDSDSCWFTPPERDYAAERKLCHALSALPEEQREVIVMHIWGELTFAQIAEVIEINANTVASRYRYALASLREVFHAKEGNHAHPRC